MEGTKEQGQGKRGPSQREKEKEAALAREMLNLSSNCHTQNGTQHTSTNHFAIVHLEKFNAHDAIQ